MIGDSDSLGPIWHSNERSRSNDLQPVRYSSILVQETRSDAMSRQDFVEVMEMLDKRLNDKGKNWRHVFKSLTVLDYILHAGSENVVLYFRYAMQDTLRSSTKSHA